MSESSAKRLKNDSFDSKNILNEFEFVKVLNEDSMTKSIFIQAKKKMLDEETIENKENVSSTNAVIILNKSHFTLDETKSFLDANVSSEVHIDNDVYKKLSIFPTKPYNSKYSLTESFFFSLKNIILTQFIKSKAFKCNLFIRPLMLTSKSTRVKRYFLSRKAIKIGWTFGRR